MQQQQQSFVVKESDRFLTLPQLVVRITSRWDVYMVDRFLTTYTMFTSGSELLEEFRNRFRASQELSDLESGAIYIKMGSLLRRWLLTIGWHDLARDPTLVIQLEDLIAEMATITKFDAAIQHLKHALRIAVEKVDRKFIPTSIPFPSVLVDETTHGHKKLYELPYLEIARQLTLIDGGFFERVSPHQMLMLGTSTFEEQCSEWHNHSTHVTRVIVSYILNGSTAEERLKYTIKFLKVARQIFEFNNFVGFKTVMDALCSKHIYPFMKLKEKDIKVDNLLLEKRYQQIIENDGREHMELLENLYPPIIPYLPLYGILLRNLYESCGPVPPNLIDVQKWQDASRIIAEPISFQKMGFNFLPMKFIQDLLLDAPVISSEHELQTKSERLLSDITV